MSRTSTRWGLAKNRRRTAKSKDHDYDYIDKLKTQEKSDNPVKAAEAKEALDFLSSYITASEYGNVKEAESIGLDISREMLREMANEIKAAERDVLSTPTVFFDDTSEPLLDSSLSFIELREDYKEWLGRQQPAKKPQK